MHQSPLPAPHDDSASPGPGAIPAWVPCTAHRRGRRSADGARVRACCCRYLTFAWKPLLQYLVFPVQFLFLYSYHPSGSMGELPKRLEEAWRARHRPAAEAAFAKAAEQGQTVGAESFFAATKS